MTSISLDDITAAMALAAAALLVIKIILRALKWDKGACIAGELQSALSQAATLLRDIRQDGSATAVEKAAETVASGISGVTTADIVPILSDLAATGSATRYGITVTLGENGQPSVEASGLAAHAAHKIGKWIKKVF